MWQFLKTIGQSIYRHTVGALVRLCRHTKASCIDEVDKRNLGRLVTYMAFGIFAWFFPLIAAMLFALRMAVINDVIGIIVNVYQETVNAYA